MKRQTKNTCKQCGTPAEYRDAFCSECGNPVRFDYSPWRHGGWYVHTNRYLSGATGCVSRNYEDGKWRIVCDNRPNAYELYTYKSRDHAALAEYQLIQEGIL